jgi:hypothetical protein
VEHNVLADDLQKLLANLELTDNHLRIYETEPDFAERAVWDVGRPVLNETGIPLMDYLKYRSFLRELGRLFRTMRGETLCSALRTALVKWQHHGLDPELMQALMVLCITRLRTIIVPAPVEKHDDVSFLPETLARIRRRRRGPKPAWHLTPCETAADNYAFQLRGGMIPRSLSSTEEEQIAGIRLNVHCQALSDQATRDILKTMGAKQGWTIGYLNFSRRVDGRRRKMSEDRSLEVAIDRDIAVWESKGYDRQILSAIAGRSRQDADNSQPTATEAPRNAAPQFPPRVSHSTLSITYSPPVSPALDCPPPANIIPP